MLFWCAIGGGKLRRSNLKAITETLEQAKEDQKAKLRDIRARKKVEADQKG